MAEEEVIEVAGDLESHFAAKAGSLMLGHDLLCPSASIKTSVWGVAVTLMNSRPKTEG